MTPDEYKRILSRLGLSQVRAGQWLGYHPRTSQAWAIGEQAIPRPVAMLLRLMIRFELKPPDVSD
jgi:hypothetical protein